MKNQTLLKFIITFFAFTYSAYGVNVTFHVDMQHETVSPQGVYLAGGHAGNPGHEMIDVDADGITDDIYSVTVSDVPINAGWQYKFSNGPIAPDWSGPYETVPVVCGFGQYFERRVEVAEADIMLPAVVFGSCAPEGQVMAMFQIDMQYETVSTEGVYLAGGSGAPWSETAIQLMPHDGGTIHSARVILNENADYVGTYLNGLCNFDSWSCKEDISGQDCATGDYNDRTFAIGSEDFMLPLTCFSSCVECATNPYVAVTFHVDMQHETVSPQGVYLAGGNAGNPGYEMIDVDADGVTDNIYSVTVSDVPINAGWQYKFSNGPIAPDWSGPYETVPVVCGFGQYFERRVEVAEADIMLPAVVFGSCAPEGQVMVKFNVDMQNETVDEAGVHLAGGNGPWSATAIKLMPDPGTTIYSTRVILDSNTDYVGTYLNGLCNFGDWGCKEDLSGQDCATGDYNDRTFAIGAEDVSLPADAFGTCAPIAVGSATVTFTADMSELIAQGWDGTTSTMRVMGVLTDWGEGATMQEDLLDPNFYTFTTAPITAPVGSMHEWKFKAVSDVASFTNGGWEVGSNHVIEFNGNDIVLEPQIPHINITGELVNAVTVDVHATWNEGTLNFNTGEAFPQTPDTLVMNGDFLGGWGTWGNCMGADCDSKVGPAASVPRLIDANGDGVYVGTVVLPAGHGNILTYKLGAYYPGVENTVADNGAMDNEAGFGADKIFVISPSATGNVALETEFGDNNPLNPWIEVDITFHLDMRDHNVSEDGIHVAGSMNEWNPTATPLHDDDQDGIYIGHAMATPGATIEYKFLNGNAWGTDEAVIDPACGGAGGYGNNRFFVVPAGGGDIPLVCFGECITCEESYVDFRVDMSEVDIISADGVFLGGGFFYPEYLPMIAGEDNMYSLKAVVPEGDLTYKFNNGGVDTGWEDGNNLSAGDCAVGNYNDRLLVVGEADMATEAVCFGSCFTCGGGIDPVEANITFAADMTNLLAQGWDDATHTINIMGTLTNWDNGVVMQQDLLDPSVYSLTVAVLAIPGSMHEWKFRAFPGENFTNGGWEVGENHPMEFTGEDIILETMVPNINITGELVNTVTVDIHATWRMGTFNINTGEAFPETPDTLVMNGDFLGGWGTWGNCMGADCDSKVGPAASVPRLTDADGDGVYVGTVVLPAGHSNILTYKLGAYYPGIEETVADNGAMDNEAGFGADKIFVISPSATGNIALETIFGDNNPMNDALLSNDNFAFMPKEFALLGNYPNPFNPVTTLQFDLDYLSNVKVTIFNVRGNEVATLQEGELEQGRHSLQWNASNASGQKVPSGLYLYRVSSDSRTLTGKMLLLK